MRLVFLVEDEGYQVRFWNELTQEIGEVLASSWEHNILLSKLKSSGFSIDRKTVEECIRKIEEEDKPFVVLSKSDEDSIDIFSKNHFEIEDDE